jgi:hypothetical protein
MAAKSVKSGAPANAVTSFLLTDGMVHVHRAGCADIRKVRNQADSISTDVYFSLLDLSTDWYQDMIGEGSMTAEQGLDSITVYPCVGDRLGATAPARRVTVTRAKATKAAKAAPSTAAKPSRRDVLTAGVPTGATELAKAISTTRHLIRKATRTGDAELLAQATAHLAVLLAAKAN